MRDEEKDDLTRREAIKRIGALGSVIATLPVIGNAQSQTGAHSHLHTAQATPSARATKTGALKFFTGEENRTVIEMAERIIPADESSPGARAARVNEYIDLIISQSPESTKLSWREGLAAINKVSRDKFGKAFADASVEQQVELLTEISKNERNPQTTEERFFRTIKHATVDGYYTSEIGIQKELRYKGNAYLKEFTGCTHPEHKG
jgi:hypothetical protein